MYLRGTFIGKVSKVVIDGDTTTEAIDSFIVLNPEMLKVISDQNAVQCQCKLMDVEYVKLEPKVVIKSNKSGIKKGNKNRKV